MDFPQSIFYPNRMGRILMLSMEEILGEKGVNLVMNLAHLGGYINNYPANNPELEFPFEQTSQLLMAMEETFGLQAARGLAQRVGRACVKFGLREYGAELEITSPAFRLLPLPKRIKAGSEALARLFNQFTDHNILLEYDERNIYWQMMSCPLCWQRQAKTPCCSFIVGLFQEALFWISGGKYYTVEEKKCIACGDGTCTIVVDRTPIL